MKATLQTIRILVVLFIIRNARCQDGFGEQDFLRLQQYTMNDGQTEAVSSYNTNAMQRGQHVQYHFNNDENNGEYSRADRSKGRKVYRIKNPFQHQLEEEKSSQDTSVQDSGTGASNQYAAMQFSLPPEEFLQKMRAENQYHQQQQLTTQISASPYTATPQPQYQYSTVQSSYDVSQQSNQLSTLDPKTYTPVYQSNINSYQYSNPNFYNLDNAHSTPTPPYLSTPLPNSQYLGTPSSNYVSSSAPLYLSSPQSLQQYVSSPNTNTQTGVVDYNNNRITTMGSNFETSNELSKRMQIDHYDNSANGVRYPTHSQNQYQNDYTQSTVSPTSSVYPDALREAWQNSLNTGYKPDNGYFQTQLQNLGYSQRDNRQETNADSSNSETHRIGSMASANNLFLNYIQPEYQLYNNIKSQARDAEPETSQSEVYSHGDYGWKLSDKKSSYEPEIMPKTNNYFKYQIQSSQPGTGAVSQVSFQMDSSKPYNYDQNTKPVTEKLETDEFVRAAAKAHERYKQQLEASKYLSNSHYTNNNNYGTHYNVDNNKQGNKVYNPNYYGNSQSEAVTASPFYYVSTRETVDSRLKQPFDHDSALKSIVPIDVSNVVQNSETSGKSTSDNDNRYTYLGYSKDSAETNLKHFNRPAESYYSDKNALYSIKSKPDTMNDYLNLDKIKQLDQNNPYYGKHQTSESQYSLGAGNKRFVDDLSLNYAKQVPSTQQESSQSSANINQQGSQQSQISSDLANILKFNDIPYRITQNLNPNNHQLRNNNYDGNIPTPLPIKINQNVDDHHLDVAAEILSKLMNNKHNNLNNRPEAELQSANLMPTINGFKIANPYNVDLKLVADMLKGKPALDDSQITSLREINKPLPMKLDISQLQQILQLKNENNLFGSNNGLSTWSNSLFDFYNSRFPYQGVKYSRSEEEPENIPIADSSNSHPIGAVVEQDDAANEEVLSEASESSEESTLSYDDDRPKNSLNSGHKSTGDRQRNAGTYSSRYSYKRKYPKSEFGEPYPLLKPPPPHNSRHRGLTKLEKTTRRRRVIKPKTIRLFKTEPLFEADTSIDDINPFNLKRAYTVAEDKSDTVNIEESV